MVAIVEEFVTGWDDLAPAIPGRGDYRILIKDGYLVRGYSVTGRLALDGAVELVRIRVDLTFPE
jgi:hypothetical protein